MKSFSKKIVISTALTLILMASAVFGYMAIVGPRLRSADCRSDISSVNVTSDINMEQRLFGKLDEAGYPYTTRRGGTADIGQMSVTPASNAASVWTELSNWEEVKSSRLEFSLCAAQ
ncbi:hypothetical protein HQ524_02300 [Candidatus Uhrbacteria bacterium]|nr:hypothetical protein [Candidatus Uhrbacteria bacterium]